MNSTTFRELHPPPLRAFRHLYSLSNGHSCKFCGMTPQEYDEQKRQVKQAAVDPRHRQVRQRTGR